MTSAEVEPGFSCPVVVQPVGLKRDKVGHRFSQVVERFKDLHVEKASDWAAGYLPAFDRDLGLSVDLLVLGQSGGGNASNRARTLLDYGCGKGAVARCMVDLLDVGHVHGCDINAVCLREAEAETRLSNSSAVGRVTYSVIGPACEGEPEHLVRDSFHGAMCNFVISILKTPTEQLGILRAVHAALAPGAPFVVLVNNPRSTGTRFASIQVGDPHTHYSPGQLVKVQMFRVDDGSMYFETRDRWWPVEHYIQLFSEAGFVDVRAEERKVESHYIGFLTRLGLDPDCFTTEAKIAPVLAVRGLKPCA